MVLVILLIAGGKVGGGAVLGAIKGLLTYLVKAA